MSEGKKMQTRYRTTNWAHYNAALKARGSLMMWLDRGMQWLAEPNGKRGSQPNVLGERQVVELLNRFSQLGRPETAAAAAVA